MSGHYTVQVFTRDYSQPVEYPDVVAPDEDGALAWVRLGWPVKREIRATTVRLRYRDKETGDA